MVPTPKDVIFIGPPPTDQARRSHNDDKHLTESAAIGVSFMIIETVTDLTVVERSFIGTGFDYWLGNEVNDNDPPFLREIRLEVSGIKNGSDSTIRKRVNVKLNQTKVTDHTQIPALVSVVEFSQPKARLVDKP